jgi:hypothetical protein
MLTLSERRYCFSLALTMAVIETFCFWSVFAPELPSIPSVEDLICRIIAIPYPKGILTDRAGKPHEEPPDIATVREAISSTIKMALESEKEYLDKALRQQGVGVPYKWGLTLSLKLAVKEAVEQIQCLLDVADLTNLDKMFWRAFVTTSMANGDKRRWQPFA